MLRIDNTVHEGRHSARPCAYFQEVLRLLASGLGNSEIALTLFPSERTIKSYVSTIFSKLGVTDRTQAAVLAIRAGLLNQGKVSLDVLEAQELHAN